MQKVNLTSNINILCIFADEYVSEAQAMAHVRRLLDIIACTTWFNKPKGQRPTSADHKSKKAKAQVGPTNPSNEEPRIKNGPSISVISEDNDMAALHPTPKLSEFYDFFSFSHITPPVLGGSHFSLFKIFLLARFFYSFYFLSLYAHDLDCFDLYFFSLWLKIY